MGSLFGKQKQVGPTQDQIMAAATPWGVQAAGIGGTTVDKEGRVVSTYIDPTMEAYAQSLMARAQQQQAGIAAYDPYTAAQEYYNQFVAPDLMKSQEQERLALENRLLSQGMLGSTGGALRSEALGQAQAASQRAARGEAFQQSQSYLDAMRQRELQDMAAAAGVYEAPIGLMQTGTGIGQSMGGILASYKPTYMQSGGQLGQALLGMGTAMATGGAFGAGGMFGKAMASPIFNIGNP